MASSRYTNEDIEKAMGFVAWIIDLYGDAYWPIFERLEEELQQRQFRSEKLRKYSPGGQVLRQPGNALRQIERHADIGYNLSAKSRSSLNA